MFWGKKTEQYLGIFLLISIAYSILLFNNTVLPLFPRIVVGVLYYQIIFTLVMVMVFQATCFAAYLPVAVSMGSSRKEAVYGMQIMPIGLIIQNMIICTVLCVIAQIMGAMRLHPDALLTYLGLSLICGALGQFFNCIYLKLGEKKVLYYAIIISSFSVSTGSAIGFLKSILFEYKPEVSIPGGAVLSLYTAGALLCILGALLYAVSLFIFRRVMRRYEVKF